MQCSGLLGSLSIVPRLGLHLPALFGPPTALHPLNLMTTTRCGILSCAALIRKENLSGVEGSGGPGPLILSLPCLGDLREGLQMHGEGSLAHSHHT